MNKYVLIIAAMACVPAAANAQDFNGGRVELRLGYETPTVSGGGDVYKIGSAVSYGGEVGYDIQAGHSVVVGPFASYEFSSVKNCDEGYCLKSDGTLNVGGRVGFVVGGNGLLYGKVEYSRLQLTASTPDDKDSTTQGGIGGAIGYEMNFGKMAYGKAEINYADYGDFFGINLQRRHVALGVGLRF